MKTVRCQIVLPLVALCIYFAWAAPFLGQWDSFDYLKQIVTHQFSALGIGRPVYIGYNILLWESMKKLFHLEPVHVEIVVMAGTVLLGVLGVVLFQRLSRQFLKPPASQMAALALAISPVYAMYSGFVMTEVPMLVALIASALILWKSGGRYVAWSDIPAGVLFGLAVGVREQALTLGAAFLWILYCRRGNSLSRLRSTALFVVSAAVVALAPVLMFYLDDRAGFLEKTKTWFHAVPAGHIQFRSNLQASLLYTLAICPGAWFAAAGAGFYRLLHRRIPRGVAGKEGRDHRGQAGRIPYPVLGIIACLLLPLAVLWCDADVQMHPRYALVVLPASLILCVSLYNRWVPSKRGAVIWAAVQILVFGMAVAALSPYRQIQTRKMEFARVIRDSVPREGLLIAGNCSPILDYYRGIGVRPEWRILWSGWNWDIKTVETEICNAWADQVPVYLSHEPSGWSYFEKELLDLHFLLKDCRKEQVAPMLLRIYPPEGRLLWNSAACSAF